MVKADAMFERPTRGKRGSERASERARERTREKTAFFPYSFVFEPIFMNHMYTEFDEESKSDIKMAKI